MLTLTSREQRSGYAVPLRVNRYHITISINNQLTITKVNQTFANPNDFEVDGIYIFPVSDDIAINNPGFSVDGKPVAGRLLSHRESISLFRSSIQQSHNRVLMEHLGKRAFVADVRGIPANSLQNIEFEYSQIVQIDNDQVKYAYPLSLAKAAGVPIKDLTIRMEIQSDAEVKAIYSPSHEIEIDRDDDHHAHISYIGHDIDPDNDFQCSYSVSDERFGMTLLTHRAEGEDGYFMLLISPKYEARKTDVIEKDFIFVLDHSGSMSGNKVTQAKEALRYCVNNLNDGDRFNIILFNTDITSLTDRLNKRREEWINGERVPNSTALSHQLIDAKEGRQTALAFIEDIEGRGMTNINDALLKALSEEPDPNRPRIIVFLTDGCPTVGVRNTSHILKNITQANKHQSRIFIFGVGYDLNVRFLDKLAMDNGGSRNYVEPHEHIEAAVSSLFRKMNEPVLTNVEVNFGHILTKELSPSVPPELFRGEQLTLLGRYERHGETLLKLRGKIGDETQEHSKNVYFAELEEDNDFLPTVWAQHRILDLVDYAAINGYSGELRKEIERLSTEYNVITPHTSFVREAGGSLRRQYLDHIDQAYDPSKPNATIVQNIKEIEHRKSTRAMHQHHNTKYFGRKTFFRDGELWVDTSYDGHSDRKIIEIGSDAYFELRNKSDEVVKCLKLHDHMVICHDGVNYEIIPPKS